MIDIAWSALIAAMLCFTLTAVPMDALETGLPILTVLGCCLAAVFVCAVIAINTATTLAALVLAAGAGVYCWRAHVDIAGALPRAFSVFTSAVLGETAAHENVMLLLIFLCVLFGILSLLLSRLEGGFYPAALLLVAVLLGCHLLEFSFDLRLVLPGLVALAVLYARAFREHTTVVQALPAAAISLVIALVLSSASPATVKPLQDAADKVRELFNDYFQFNDPRVVYTVASDGYQPLIDLLGGPASPRPGDVMLVESDEPILLRGSVNGTYTGRNWQDDAVNSRYLYIDPTRMGKRDAAFDADLASNLRGRVHKLHVAVTFLDSGTSTLFVPQRMTGLDTAYDLPAYYNETGEVFVTRDVQPGDRYELDTWQFDTDLFGMRDAVVRASAQRDADFQAVSSEYLALPTSIEADLYWLTQELTEGQTEPFDKALAIRSYLCGDGFYYTLDARYAPEGRDFVSWFVLDEKHGYCTYYASAMAVMARLCGIPSRYCEGYAVESDGSGRMRVTGEMAHAWAELYFSGVGWVAFDATPGNAEDPGRGGDPDIGGHGDETDQTPEPSPTPTPEPTPDPQDHTALTDATDTPSPGGATPSPTPPADQPPPDSGQNDPPDAPDPDNTPDQNDDSKRHIWPWLLVILLMALAVAALRARRRLIDSDPAHVAEGEKDARIRAMIWYRAVLSLLERQGLTPAGAETPVMFAERAARGEDVPVEMAALAQAITRLQYSPEGKAAEVERLGQYVYSYMLSHMSRADALRWRLRLMRSGLGDYRQIP